MNLIEFPKDQDRKKNQLDSIVLSTRVRIARNIEGIKFLPSIKEMDKKILSDKICDLIKRLPYNMTFENIENLEHSTVMSYLANNIITKEFIRNGHCFIYENSGDWSILINEDDHIRLTSIDSGYNIKNIYNRLSGIVSDIEHAGRFRLR